MALKLERNRRLSEFSTFAIGGPIQYFTEVKSADEMQEAFQVAQQLKVPHLIIGKGSNCLFPDLGFQGLAILNKIDTIQFRGNEVEVGSGYSFSLLGVQTARQGLSGLEFASGIPATVGGAVFMNAGANGKEVSECLASVSYLHFDGKREELSRDQLAFSYRKSPFQTMNGAILAARFALQSFEGARKSQLQIVENRMKTQPLREKSAGCAFRNPQPGVSAGALIDKCGLKGLTVGGAKVSEIHANFLVNHNHATAQDVLELVGIIQERVAKQTAIHLELEIRVIS